MRNKKKITNNSTPEKLSVIIPVYNEELRFKQGFKICQRFIKKYPKWEFIFVNDGSKDKTRQLIEKLIKPWPQMRMISYANNQGKGYALKQGVRKASKPLVLICDIDFSTPLSEISLFQPFINKRADVVIGSRKTQGANIIKPQSIWREYLGRQFTNLSKLWLGLNVSDVTCGFKLFKTPVAKRLFAKSRIKRWGYDAEILFLAKKLGYQVVDVAVSWKNDERTKVSVGRDIVRSLTDLYLIRLNNFLGKYKL